jgi:inner membrane protein
MASIFGHVAASTALGMAFFPRAARPATFVIAGVCAFAPDLDVAAFEWGVPYASIWGHRGWTHSVAFAVVFGGIVGFLSGFFIKLDRSGKRALLLWCVLSTLTHPLLDMCTDGGLGCALWWPFEERRLFFPWRPILVSPLGAANFFSPWGLEVLVSEVKWIGLPCLALVMLRRKI